jgi:predicted RNA-binding Zn-ribbon protein involved in translation (DUF1610 family)
MSQNTVKLSCSRCGKAVAGGKHRKQGRKYVCKRCRVSDPFKVRAVVRKYALRA